MPHTAAMPQVGPPTGPQQFGVQSVPQRGGRNKIVAGVAVLALVVGAVGGGIGGVIGYDLARQNPQSVNSLNQPLPSANSTSGTNPTSVEQVAQKVLPSVVELQVQGKTASGDGSGIIISNDGLILTNNHVVADAAGGGQITAVFQDGKTAPATVVGTDSTSDVAVVRANGVSGLTPATLGRSDNLVVGQQVVAIGSPFGLAGTVTQGIISALQRPVRAGGSTGNAQSVLDAIQTDAPINPGNSGGPLVDTQGNVIGINSAIYSPQTVSGNAGSVGLGFSIPVNQARRIGTQLVNSGKATEAALGVKLNSQNNGPGATVATVDPGSAAEKAGIKAGDVITKLDNRRIPDGDTLVAAVRSHAPGDHVKITVNGNPNPLDVTLGTLATG
jgi:putative serine protease PepD